MNRIICCISNILPILYIPVYFLSSNLIRSDLVFLFDAVSRLGAQRKGLSD